MPIPGAASAKVSTTASAWSRLVQLTRTASNAPKSDAAESSGRYESLPAAILAITPPPRPVRTQRLTKSPRSAPTKSHQTSSPQDASAMSQQNCLPAGFPCRAEADCIEVCPCQQGDLPLPDGKCSLTRPKKRSTAASPPKHIDLRTFWARRPTEQKTASSNRADGSSVKFAEAKLGKQRQDTTPETNTSAPEMPHVLSRVDGEQSAQSEPARPADGNAESNKLQFRRAAKQQLADSTSAPPTTTRGLLSPRVLVRTSQRTSPEVSAPRPRRTRFDGHDVANYKQEAEGPVNKAVITRDVAMENHKDGDVDRADTEMPIALTAEGSENPTLTLKTPHITESVLQESSQDRINRATQPGHLFSGAPPDDDTTQLATPTSSQEDPAASPSLPSEADDNELAPARKTKRRLTLHAGEARDAQRVRKRQRNTAPPVKKKQTVQTTLSLAIGGSAGMRECKVCDTVYNPFHPEDVKVHAKRHAGALKNRGASV